MDWSSLIGIALAIIAILFGQLLEGGHLGSLIQPAAFVVVVLGTVGAVILQSGQTNFVRGLKLLKHVFFPQQDNYHIIIDDMQRWSIAARREGLLSLQRYLTSVQDPFTAKGLRLIIDGIDPFKLREVLETEISVYEHKGRQAVKIWSAAGGYAPTIGILGAVLGLIHVMENLSDPARLGSGIAVAFVATIYGVGLANLVFLPIANKLKDVLSNEIAVREMILSGLCCIASGDNPILIAERLRAYER